MITIWVISFLASLGALAVFVGLFLEKIGDKDEFDSVGAFRKGKSRRKIGERLVRWGVFSEMLLGFGITAWESWKSFKNDPGEKPIASASARADIVFKEAHKKIPPLKPFFVPGSNDIAGWHAGIYFMNGSNALLSLVASPSGVSVWGMGSDIETECKIVFEEDPLNFLQSEAARNQVLVKQFDNVDWVAMYVGELQTNIEVVSGGIYLTVNDSKWVFAIPPQKPKWGLITLEKIKNKAGKVETKIHRVQLTDFVYPPRFTNLWYDGQ